MGLFSGLLKVGGAVASAAGFPIAGGLASALGGTLGQDETNRQNLDIANQTNATTIDLANTAYQRRVKDLTAAGLNPMLAYTQGGAQAPSLNTPRFENSYAAGQQSELVSAQIAKTKADTTAAVTSADVNSASAAEIRTRTQGQAIDVEEKGFLRDNAWKPRISQLLNNVNLTATEMNFVEERIRNAIKEGRKIDAETGNVKVDTTLKRAQTILSDVESKNKGLETSRHQAESDFYKSTFGHKVAPFVNSAGNLVYPTYTGTLLGSEAVDAAVGAYNYLPSRKPYPKVSNPRR